MSTIIASNVNSTNSFVANTLISNGLPISDTITVGNVNINSTALTVGNSSITPTNIKVDSLVLGGVVYGGFGPFGAIVNTQIFTANGTWTNPYNDAGNPIQSSLSGNEQVLVMMWGGGGGNATNYGGGGGACGIITYRISDLGSTVSITVGVGGSNAPVTNGGNSVFGNFTVYGGAGSYSGGGGGLMGTGNTIGGGAPLGGVLGNPGGTSTFGGGGGALLSGAVPGSSIFGGGGGTYDTSGANSIYGGGGGGTLGAGGTSIFGGKGGNNSISASVPGGGGAINTAQSGARGEVRVWVFK